MSPAANRPAKGSVLFWVQHLLGIGHLRRAVRIIRVLARDGIAVTLVSGGEPLDEIHDAGAARVVQLPPLRSPDSTFKRLVDSTGRPVDETLWQARRSMLLDAVAAAPPDAVMLETYPFGRVKFWPEIDSLIAAVRAASPRAPVIASLRDIVVVGDKPERRRAIVERVRDHVDAILVHGDPSFIPLDASFPETPQIRDRLVYTGYVGDGAPAAEPAGAQRRGEVLVSAGGGAMGGPLLRAAIEARRAGCLGDSVWRVLTGPNLPAVEFAQLAAGLPERVVVERYRTDFPERLRRCRASISQGGYNTTLDILACGAPAVIVPFAGHDETEQRLRTERLAARGLIEMIDEAELSPPALAAALTRAVERGEERGAGGPGLDFGGAEFTARVVAAALSGRRADILSQ